MAFGVDDAALVGAGATILGTGISAVGQSSLNKKTREFNREEAEKQRAWSEQMYNAQNSWNYERWQEQNAYNNPEAQVQRMRDAGLNPLFYGLDGSSAGEVSSAQPLGYERAQLGALPNPFSGFGDTALKVAQIANIQANTAKTGEETLSEVQRRERIIADIDLAKQELNNMKSSQNLTDKQIEQIDRNLSWLDRLNEATIAEKESRSKLDDSQRKRIEELLDGEKLIQSKTAEDFDKRWQKIEYEIEKMSKETGILQKDIENYALNHASNGFMGTGLSLQNLFRAIKSDHPRPGEENKFSDDGSDWRSLVNSGQ